ncbi:MAG: phosphoribosylglycinamide formyltransferase [Pseudomonadota bacterium]|nr:phosphoribosylglycinamide formyltransferase [Pseudomonadota bacterium]
MITIGFLASGNGTSLRAIVAAIEAGALAAQAGLVVSNNKNAAALTFARDHGIAARWIPTLGDPQAADADLIQALADAGVELVVLSGYLRKLGPRVLAAYKNRILNIHPALLPKFGGEGMYGRRVHEAVLAAKESVTGATVHLVDGQYDHGAIVAQARVIVRPGDTAEVIEAKVMAAEPGLYLDTLRRILSGALTLPAR